MTKGSPHDATLYALMEPFGVSPSSAAAAAALQAIIQDLNNGHLDALNFYCRPLQVFDARNNCVIIEWTLLGEKVSIKCPWTHASPPRGNLGIVGGLRQKVIRLALDVMAAQLGRLIMEREAK